MLPPLTFHGYKFLPLASRKKLFEKKLQTLISAGVSPDFTFSPGTRRKKKRLSFDPRPGLPAALDYEASVNSMGFVWRVGSFYFENITFDSCFAFAGVEAAFYSNSNWFVWKRRGPGVVEDLGMCEIEFLGRGIFFLPLAGWLPKMIRFRWFGFASRCVMDLIEEMTRLKIIHLRLFIWQRFSFITSRNLLTFLSFLRSWSRYVMRKKLWV